MAEQVPYKRVNQQFIQRWMCEPLMQLEFDRNDIVCHILISYICTWSLVLHLKHCCIYLPQFQNIHFINTLYLLNIKSIFTINSNYLSPLFSYFFLYTVYCRPSICVHFCQLQFCTLRMESIWKSIQHEVQTNTLHTSQVADYLSEITMSLLVAARSKNPQVNPQIFIIL